MASKTIDDLTVVTSAAASDLIAIWRAANSDTRSITKANLLGGVLTGGGTIATGGFTGTLPATGTLALLATAQTFSALKTFSAGLSFGQDTLNYYDEGTWTPTDGSGAGLAFSGAAGRYTRIGRLVLVDFSLTYPTTADTNPASISGLPFSVTAPAGSHGGGGYVLSSGYTNAFRPLVQTTPNIIFLTPAGVPLTNANLSGLLIRIAAWHMA